MEHVTTADMRKILKEKKSVIGTQRTLKYLKKGEVATVFLTKNCPDSVKQDMDHYASLSPITITNLDLTNEELGEICKKPFSISVLSLLKE